MEKKLTELVLAFAGASNLTAVVAGYSGPNYFLAHSFGNMLVSAAIQDWRMPCERYFMLNAAVPIEAYDTSTNVVNDIGKDRMLPRVWAGYDDALKASHWHDLFAGQGRLPCFKRRRQPRHERSS